MRGGAITNKVYVSCQNTACDQYDAGVVMGRAEAIKKYGIQGN